MSAKFPANPPGSNTDTSHGRSLPANCGRKPGLVGESCLLEPHSSSAPSPPQLPAGPDFLPRHRRLGFHTLGSSSSSSQKHNGKGGIFVGLCLKGRGGKKHSAGLLPPKNNNKKTPPPTEKRKKNTRNRRTHASQSTSNFTNFAAARPTSRVGVSFPTFLRLC